MSDPPANSSASTSSNFGRWALVAVIVLSGLALIFKWISKPRFVYSPIPAMKKMEVEIASAVLSFKADYNKWPIVTTTDEWDGYTESSDLVDCLSRTNSRKIDYLDGFKTATTTNGSLSNGIDVTTKPGHPQILDYWGTPFQIRIDANGDKKVIDPRTGLPITKECILWSAGPDRDFATWEDNISIW